MRTQASIPVKVRISALFKCQYLANGGEFRFLGELYVFRHIPGFSVELVLKTGCQIPVLQNFSWAKKTFSGVVFDSFVFSAVLARPR